MKHSKVGKQLINSLKEFVKTLKEDRPILTTRYYMEDGKIVRKLEKLKPSELKKM